MISLLCCPARFETKKKLVQVYGHEIKRIPYSDSESDDELDFPEIDDSELIRKFEETAAKSKSTKVEFTFVRNLPYNPIQPSKVLKRNFIDQECSSKSNIINQDIPSASNAKRNREDGFKSNCEIPKKKMRYNSPEIDCACDPVIDLQNKEKPVLAMLNDGHDTFMNYSYKETPQYKSKDILPEEPFLHTEECLNNDPTWVSYRMRKQENANSNKSDILEELNDDFSSEDQLSTLYDFGKFEGGIFWDFPKEEIVAVNKLKQRELIDQNVIKDKKTNTSSEEEGSISNEILTGKNLHDLNVGMKERNFSFSSLSNEDFSNVKSFENKPLPDCVFFDNEDSSLSVTGNCSTTPNSVELLARRSSDILRDEAEQKNKNNFFSEFITLSSSSNDSFTGEEKDSDFSGQNYNVPAIVLNKQNNDGESMDNKTYIERLSERFIVPKENKGKKT
ncbi:hypothetical protein TNCT_290191 [Trichonephila clavata]|uniref:Uncharacterized protein n=1 Tax=Trichonephila clavata TaxID=2740835 RepID=A0A8X6FFN1_TRICU|nr:hypothetical protein TNCT_290191 [Trichonephila clavata]